MDPEQKSIQPSQSTSSLQSKPDEILGESYGERRAFGYKIKKLTISFLTIPIRLFKLIFFRRMSDRTVQEVDSAERKELIKRQKNCQDSKKLILRSIHSKINAAFTYINNEIKNHPLDAIEPRKYPTVQQDAEELQELMNLVEEIQDRLLRIDQDLRVLEECEQTSGLPPEQIPRVAGEAVVRNEQFLHRLSSLTEEALTEISEVQTKIQEETNNKIEVYGEKQVNLSLFERRNLSKNKALFDFLNSRDCQQVGVENKTVNFDPRV